MSLTASEMTPADIAAVSGNNNSGNGFGDGNGAWWLIVLFLFAAMGGWGNGFGGNGGGNSGAGSLYPWINQSNQINDGFRDQMLNTTVNGIQQGVNNLSTQLCNCCGDMQMALANGFANAETADNARQMANMNQAFAGQMAMTQGFNALGTQFADCCCENRLGIANLSADIAREACADRATVSDGIRDVITNQTANTQAILDKLCQQELDAERRENQNLRTELNMANLQASQTAQTAEIQRGQVAEIDAMYNRLKDCPVPTQPVYGIQPIFTCNGGNGCGCGCGSNL